MIVVQILVLGCAFTLFCVAALREPGRYNLTAAGLACYIIYLILGHLVR